MGQLRKGHFPLKRDFKMLALAEGMQWADSTGAQDTVLGEKARGNRITWITWPVQGMCIGSQRFPDETRSEILTLNRLVESLGKRK